MPLPQVYAPTTGDKIKGVLFLPIRIFGWLVVWGVMVEIFGSIGTLLFIVVLAIAQQKLIATVWRKIETPRAEPEAPSVESLTPREELLLGRAITDDGNLEPLAIPEELRSRHCYLIGKSGTGKTTLVSNMIVHDMERGHGLAFLDPHGDAAKNLLGCVPRERLDDVIYYNPMARMSPAFNPLRLPYDPAKLAADMLSVFQTFSGDSWESAPRMQHVLRNAFTLLITDSKPHTLRDLRTLCLDPHMRQDVISRAKDPDLIDFWTNEFPTIPQSSVQPILTRLSALLAPLSPLARIFSNPENELDFSAMLQQGKIFIVNLAKGEMGDEPSKLLGGLFTAAFQQAALARARIPESQRRPFFLYVDEFQNFTIKSTFDSILSESRKYRLYLTLAHQDISQIPQNVRSAIFGNVATLISFGISANDAPVLRKEMHRTRLSVRIPETPDYIPLADFVAYQKEQYRNALSDKNWGMSREERRAVKEASMGEAFRFYSGRRAQLERALAALDQAGLNAQVLHELFPNYQFRELEFPALDDFLNLPAYHAFCRIEHADNVFCFQALPPPASSDETRHAVYARLRERLPKQQSQASAGAANQRAAQPPPPQADGTARANGHPASPPPPRGKSQPPPTSPHEKAPNKEDDFSF